VLLGIDDTDSPEGGCTTWVLSEVVRRTRELGLDLIGEPRLVRLNPNIAWKTRGNAALALRAGHGSGVPRAVGEIGGAPVLAFDRGRPLRPREQADLVEAAWEAVLEGAPRAPGTDPALVAVPRPLPASLYWSAVRDVVTVPAVLALLRRERATFRTRGGRRGLVGAAAAVAWPGRRRTWELLAYRRRDLWGTPRYVDAGSVRDAERAEPSLFLCQDPRTRRLLVAPHTPCPILFGLRAREAGAARRALGRVRSEPIERWVLYRTNQGTGDHLARHPISALAAGRSAFVLGAVAGPAVALRGGHARFPLRDAAGDRLSCLAFEPTKTLPALVRRLVPGDRLEVWGSLRRRRSFHLEGIRLVSAADRRRWLPPRCPGCARTAGSMGRGRGWRCPGCRRRFPPEAGRRDGGPPAPSLGVYHPTRSARRHLAPLGD